MRPITVSVGPLGATSATNIRTATTGTAGALVLNGSLVSGGVAVLPSAQQILFTTSASEAGKTILLTGTNRAGFSQSETIALPSSAATVASVLDYTKVTSAVLSANSTGNISIGTNGIAGSQWVRFDDWAPSPLVSIQVNVIGTVNYTVQTTLDDPNSPTNPVSPANVSWFSSSDAAVVGATSAKQSSLSVLPVYARVLLNSGSGTVTATFLQTGNVSL